MTTAHYSSGVWADERNALGVISCVAGSCVNLARVATDAAVAASDAEVIALRTAAGDLAGGMTLQQGQAGMTKRYGFGGELRDGDWSWIVTQFGLGWWFVGVGWYDELPARLRNAGQANVFHAVLFGPKTGGGFVIVDSLERDDVVMHDITITEIRRFLLSGGFTVLGLPEFSQCSRVTIRSFAGIFTVYLDGHYRRNLLPQIVPFTSRVGEIEVHRDANRRNPRDLVQLKATSRAGKWVNVHSTRVTYYPKKGA